MPIKSKFMNEITSNEEGVAAPKRMSWFKKIPTFWIIVVILVSIVLFFFLGSRGLLPFRVPFVSGGINPSTYQAVFMVNNQVYFGKMHFGGDWVRLTDVFYLRVTQQLQPPTEDGQQQVLRNLQMVKLGGELHQPEDEMFIDRDKILFWENLNRDSQVVQFIDNFKAQQ